ncbi:MAG: rhodanese-like domain-containing protein [Bacteroidetes bacterium]|nr:rhodanese-like domain-containing protein [Bacteroidota bacterium]
MGNNKKIIDVRTQEEFKEAHAPGSINIPLQEIPQRMDEFKTLETPFILCCAGGTRSGRAMEYLSAQGFECENGGSWKNFAK